MLQWMGGSRRKVTTSRKSTHKRQKQYFEQRKRQQQQTAVLDCYADPREHRSLDVLSMLNLSTTAEEHKCVCPNVDYPITKVPPRIFTNTETFADSVEYKDAGTSSGYQVETISPNNFKFTVPDNQNNAFGGSSYNSYLRKTTTDQEISVFDLLADDGPSGNLEGSPVHEAHVAFSVEGLGKLGTQTPIRSPERSERMFQYGCSSPRKAARRHKSLKNFDRVLDDLELEVDVMMQDMNMPRSGSHLEFSSGTINSHSHRKHKYSTDCAPFDDYGSKLKSSFDDSEFFHGTGKNNNEDLWDARSSFLDDNFLNENEFKASGVNWSGQMEGNDFSHYGNELSDYAFLCLDLHENRVSVKAADKYNILDSSSPKQQTLENIGGFITSKMTRYPAAGRNFDFKEPISQLDWTYHENARDNLSLLSEESCSSTAVRSEAKNESPANSTASQSRRPKDISGSDGNTNGLKNIYAKETQHQSRFDIQQGSCTHGSGKCTRIHSPSHSKQFHLLNSHCQEIFGPQDSLLFDKGYTSAAVISDFGSFHHTSEMKVPAVGSKPQTLDAFIGFPIPESQMGPKSSFDGSKYGNFVQYSSLGCTDYEKFPFRKSSSHMSCHGSPKCPNLEFDPTKPSLYLDSKPGCLPSESFYVPGSRGEMLFPDLSVLESVSKDEGSKSKAQSAKNKKLEPDKISCSGNNCLLSMNDELTGVSNCEDNIVECNELNGVPSEQKGSTKTPPSSEHVEETSSSSVKNPDKFEHVADKRCLFHTDLHIDDVGSKRKLSSNCIDSHSQVVMLESYVLKLLCVQKVLKDASEQVTMKKERLLVELVGSLIHTITTGISFMVSRK